MFDDVRVKHLAHAVTRVRLAQASASGAALGTEGALILGWLATRLGWKASSLAGKLRLLRADGAPILVQLGAEAASHAPRGTLVALEINAAAAVRSSQGGEPEPASALHGEIVRTGTDGSAPGPRRRPGEAAGVWKVAVTLGGETQRLEQRVRVFADEPGAVLERTLRRPAHDDALAESVAWADELGDDELVCA
jgi:hypothetical protein